jgi:hypothetical protein
VNKAKISHNKVNGYHYPLKGRKEKHKQEGISISNASKAGKGAGG